MSIGGFAFSCESGSGEFCCMNAGLFVISFTITKFISNGEFAKMTDRVVLINTARDDMVDIKALVSKRILSTTMENITFFPRGESKNVPTVGNE